MASAPASARPAESCGRGSSRRGRRGVSDRGRWRNRPGRREWRRLGGFGRWRRRRPRRVDPLGCLRIEGQRDDQRQPVAGLIAGLGGDPPDGGRRTRPRRSSARQRPLARPGRGPTSRARRPSQSSANRMRLDRAATRAASSSRVVHSGGASTSRWTMARGVGNAAAGRVGAACAAPPISSAATSRGRDRRLAHLRAMLASPHARGVGGSGHRARHVRRAVPGGPSSSATARRSRTTSPRPSWSRSSRRRFTPTTRR